MLRDTIIPSVWFNAKFSEIENFDISQRPYEFWFRKDEFFLIKREWIYTNETTWGTPLWRCEWNIVWWVLYNDTIYVYDDLKKVYKFYNNWGAYALLKIYNNTDTLSLYTTDINWQTVKQKAYILPYISWLEKTFTVDWINTTNNDWSWNVVLSVNEANTFASWDVWKCIYIKTSTLAQFQIRQISQYVTATKVYLSEMFYQVPANWDTWELYTEIYDMVVFNNLRKTVETVLCIDTKSAHTSSLRYLAGNDSALFEWRLWLLNQYWTSIWGSLATWEYEILDPLAVIWTSKDNKWESIKHIEVFQRYILCFYNNNISAIWKLWNDTNGDPIFTITNILSWVSTFWVYSFIVKDWTPYFFANNKKIYTLWITAVSEWVLQWTLQDQWNVIQEGLNLIESTDEVRLYSDEKWLWIIIKWTSGTRIFKYYSNYQWWLLHTYTVLFSTNIFKINWKEYFWIWKDICWYWWAEDLWNAINQKLVVTWPTQEYWSIFKLLQIKLLLWYYTNLTDFDCTLELWQEPFKMIITKNATWMDYVTWNNQAATDTTLWSNVLWYLILGWENPSEANLSKIWLVWLRIWKWWIYYKITLTNKDNKNLNIWMIDVQYVPQNPYLVPVRNVK